MTVRIVFDGTHESAGAICRAVREMAPELCDDQAPAFTYTTMERADCVYLWTIGGDETAHAGDTVLIDQNVVTVIHAS